jgi:hypothetical protein
MAGMGHQRPFTAILAQRLLSGVKRTLSNPISRLPGEMSAFSESGRSEHCKSGKSKGS